MTEIEQLIQQAKAVKRKWRKPKEEPRLTNRTWQEILDNKPYPQLRFGRL